MSDSTRENTDNRFRQPLAAVTRGQIRDIILIVTVTALITYFHNWPPHIGIIPSESLHILLRRLYYIPIIYAAFRFGIKGGLLTSLTITALFAPHAARSMGGLFKGAAVDNFFDLLIYNVVAITTGMVVDDKRRQAQRYQETLKLNREIEERETALRQIKAYTDSILSSISSGVISLDRRGNIVTANPEAMRILGRKESELVGFPLEKIFRNQERLVLAARRILNGEQQRATMEAEVAGEGQVLTVAIRITPHLSRGETVGIVITIEDLTEVKNLTEQLMRADKLSGLGELVAGVAHEVRNPLGVIRASVQMMEKEMETGCKSSELTHVMLQEIDRLDAVVKALLDFGRPSKSQFERIDVQQSLEEVILLTRQFALQQQVGVSRNFAEDLPALWADDDQLKQVFVNLISNAIQAMPDGGRLSISVYTEGGFIKISFADSGTGISTETRERIFDPFFTTRAGGSGLGLSIVHRIVDAHNGYMQVRSRVGTGSTFTVSLPLIKRGERPEVEINA